MGFLVTQTLMQLARPLFQRSDFRPFDYEFQLNFAVLKSLVNLFRSGDTSHILCKRVSMPKMRASFYLGIDCKYRDCFEKVNMHKTNFEKILKMITGVDEVLCVFENRMKQVRINAFGYKWNLVQLRIVLAQDKFLSLILNKLAQKHAENVLDYEERLSPTDEE